MPTLLIWHGYKFRFYALNLGEPPHVHIAKDGRSLKVWLRSLEVAKNSGYNDREVSQLLMVVSEHRDEWMRVWNDFFGV